MLMQLLIRNHHHPRAQVPAPLELGYGRPGALPVPVAFARPALEFFSATCPWDGCHLAGIAPAIAAGNFHAFGGLINL